MNSFTLHAVGNLARNPELMVKKDVRYVQFCLEGEDYAGKNEGGDEMCVVSSVWFHALGVMGDDIHQNARKGDQLIVQARVTAAMKTTRTGERYCDAIFIVTGYRFGAPRGGSSGSAASARSPFNPTDGATEERTIAVV